MPPFCVYMKYEEIKEKILDRWNLDIERLESYKVHDRYSFSCKSCGHIWEQALRFDRNLSCPNCHPSEHGSSRGELELYDLLLTSGLNVVNGNRKALDGKELDIYFPDLNFGIEYDGAHWHNEADDRVKDSLAESKGIFLFRIDDYEFSSDRNGVLEKLKEVFQTVTGVTLNIHPELVNDVVRVSERCRKIVCTDTMKVYDSYLHAGKDTGLNPREILSVCNGNAPNTHGFHFRYFDPSISYEKTEPGYEFRYRHVRCVETGEVFNSVNDAKKIAPVDDVLLCRQKTAGGLHWEYTDDPPTDTSDTISLVKRYSKKKRVLARNRVFESVKEASEEFGLPQSLISAACRGEIRAARGIKFQYLDEPHEFVPKRRETKRVYCSDLKMVFNSVEECARYFKAPNPNAISRVCRGERKAYKKHKFVYKEDV